MLTHTHNFAMIQFRSFGNAIALLTAIIAVFVPSSLHAEITLKLAWDPNPETDVVGYRVGWGTYPDQMTFQMDAGANTSVAIEGLNDDTIYYFTVAAINAAGLVSDPAPVLTYRTLPLEAPSAYNSWLANHGLEPGSGSSDPDRDGIDNLIESLCGGNPWQADAAERGKIRSATKDGHWELEWILNRSVAGDPRVSHEIVYSVDGMRTWHEMNTLPGFMQSVIADGAGQGLDRVRVRVPLDSLDSSSVFVRLRAVLQE
jgi:hypothetical protein